MPPIQCGGWDRYTLATDDNLVFKTIFMTSHSSKFSGRVTFIGAGRMATALASGLAREFMPADRILAFDPSEPARDAFSAATGCATTIELQDVTVGADVIVLAVKPQVMPSVLQDMCGRISAGQLVVSVAAGVTIAALSAGLKTERVIRVMPNTPCLIGHGAAAVAAGPAATAEDSALVQNMLQTVGVAIAVPESQIDAVTGLSGSGPAYIYQIIEALSDGGVRVGLPRETATTLAAQTVLGAAAMVMETGEHPAALKDAVTSPGGTTIAGLHELERAGLRAALMNAVQAATIRAKQLGN